MKDKKQKKSKRNGENSDLLDLPALLSWGMFSLPKFLDDFPAIIISLDAGEYVNVSNISEPLLKDLLNRIMVYLPVLLNDSEGWYKKDKNTSVSGFCLKYLLEIKAIRQPTQLSASEQLSSQHAPQLVLNLIKSFPELKGDFPSLLSNILDGNAVQLEDIANEDVRFGLEKLFKCVDLVDGSDGFALPSAGRKQDVVVDTLKHLLEMFNSCNQYEKQYGIKNTTSSGNSSSGKHKKDKKDSKKGGSDKKSHSRSSHHKQSSSSSSDSNSSDSESGSENDNASASGVDMRPVFNGPVEHPESSSPVRPTGPVAGPSMPSAQELRFAQQANLQYRQQQQEDGANQQSDDDDFGPQMYNPAAERLTRPSAVAAHQTAMLAKKMQAQPLGFLEQVLEEADAPVNKYQLRYGEYVEVSEEEAMRAAEGATKREEWILDPGSNKLIGELKGIGTKNRQFQSGKVANKAAEQFSAAREAAEGRPDDEETLRTKAIMAEYRDQRGLTLMEQHQEKVKAGGLAGQKAASIAAKRKAFERDDEMGSVTKLDPLQVRKMVETARDLDSRFDKGSVQKNFL